jgi:ABC-2 type transport system permease protein
MKIILLFLWKEMRDARRNPYLLPGYLVLPPVAIFLPVILTALAPMILAVDPNDPMTKAIIRIAATTPEFQGLGEEEAITRFFLRNLIALYFIFPVGLSSIAAAFSIVAEKQQRTLEPILAAPIADRDFLLGKLVAAVLPAIVLTWVSALLAIVMVDIIGWRLYGRILLPDSFWLLGIGVLAPLLGIASVLASMRISAKLTDPQAANQATALVIIPGFMLLIGLFGKLLALSLAAVVAACVAILGVCIVLFMWNLRGFQREEILTRWK